MIKNLTSLFISIIIISCSSKSNALKENNPISPLETFTPKALNINKNMIIGDSLSPRGVFKISILSKTLIDSEVKYERKEDEYYNYSRTHVAEREERIIWTKINLKASAKWSTSGSSFLPEFKIYKKIDTGNELTKKSFVYLKDMTINFYKDPKENYSFLEQYFNYKESGVFILWAPLSTENLKYPIYITASMNSNTDFEKDNIISEVSPKN